MVTVQRVWLLLALLPLFACGGRDGTSLVHVPPTALWKEQLAAVRAAKDRQFSVDPETPLLADDVEDFQGLDYWPPDPEYYLAGTLQLYPEPEQLTLLTTAGEPRPTAKIGWVSFTLGGQRVRLQVYQLLDSSARPGSPESLFLPFTDATSGTETYPAGRYVTLLGAPGGPYVLDFNMAHNPYCAYGSPERFACPATPPENRLPLRIEAGERGFRHQEERG